MGFGSRVSALVSAAAIASGCTVHKPQHQSPTIEGRFPSSSRTQEIFSQVIPKPGDSSKQLLVAVTGDQQFRSVRITPQIHLFGEWRSAPMHERFSLMYGEHGAVTIYNEKGKAVAQADIGFKEMKISSKGFSQLVDGEHHIELIDAETFSRSITSLKGNYEVMTERFDQYRPEVMRVISFLFPGVLPQREDKSLPQ